MPDRNRGQKLAFGIGLVAILVIAATVAFSGNAHGKPVAANERHASGSGQTQAEITKEPKSLPSALPTAVQADIKRIAGALEAANTKQQTADEQKDAAKNLDDQNSMAESARRMFWVGVGETGLTLMGVILVGWTLYHTKRAADEAKRAADSAAEAIQQSERHAQQELRAYVFVEAVSFYRDENELLVIKLTTKNTGSTPAYKMSSYGSTGWYKVGVIPDWKETETPSLESTLAAGKDSVGLLKFSKVPDAWWTSFMNKETSLYLWGKIVYRDIFDKPHTTRFRVVNHGGPNYAQDGFIQCQGGNETD